MQVLFNTPFLNDYMKLVEDTESPRLFHLWAAISGISAALGRRSFLPFGLSPIFPNQYILVVGTPGTRKSTAAGIMRSLLRDSTRVRFAPKDTGGQRQGLISAMRGQTDNPEFVEGLDMASISEDSLAALTLDAISESTNIPPAENFITAMEDKHSLYAVSSEITQLIGQNNLPMLDFLTTMYDGDDYDYQLKESKITLTKPLLGLIGCTTPSSISNALPAAAGGQGLLSRMILVYGSKKYKSVPRPTAPPAELVSKVKESLSDIYLDRAGAFTETKEAASYVETLYDIALEITDSRFAYYQERRFTHLLKLAMALAAGRGSQEIVKDDYYEAHRILRATERGMPDALGQFGLNPLAAVKQQILDYIRLVVVAPVESIQAAFHRDARTQEIHEVITDLAKSRQIMMTQQANGSLSCRAVFKKENTDDAIMNALKEV